MPFGYYSFVRPLIARLDPETAHRAALWALKHRLVPAANPKAYPNLELTVWGHRFTNPIGIAAGFDKNAECIVPLSHQGFGFIEAGTVTPRPQEGNSRPRIFRLEKERGVINRLGFNNMGMAVFVANLERAVPRTCVLGANLGRNVDAADPIGDYVTLLGAVYPHCDYITINISSPNTAGLRGMQGKSPLTALLSELRAKREEMMRYRYPRLPLLVKIAPDLNEAEMDDIAEVALAGCDGLIVSNTTIQHSGEKGGLSGAPLFARSTEVLRAMYARIQGKIPLIGVGGISSGADAYAKICAGASLVQLYTALTYEGFELVDRMKSELSALLERDGFKSVAEAVGARK